MFEVFDKLIVQIRVELSDISNTLEKKSVTELDGSVEKLLKLSIAREHLSIALIGSQVDCKSDQFFADDGFWTVDDQLVDQGNAISVGEGCLSFVFQG